MAYPFGSYNARVAALAAEADYSTAATVTIGLSSEEPLLELKRVPITGHDTLLDFVLRLRTGWSVMDLVRQRLPLPRRRGEQAGA
jgi:hypothetical protein